MDKTYLLHHSASVHLQRQGQDMPLHLLRQDALLHLVPMLKELLDDIVSEDVRHQLQGILSDLREHNLLLVAIRGLELLLDEPGSVLVTAELDNMSIDILF
jgi:hypothetical protein